MIYKRGQLRVIVPGIRDSTQTEVIALPANMVELIDACKKAGRRGRIQMYDGETWVYP